MPLFLQSVVRRSIIGGLFVALTLLAACSAVRLTYNQGPQLVYWRFDSYVDFDDAQSALAKQSIAEWFHWHRTTQLKDYAALLARAGQQAAEPTTAAAACRWVEDIAARMQTAYERAIPAAAEILRTLSPAQVRYLERKYAKVDDEFGDEHLQSSPKDRLAAAVKRVVKNADRLYGSVTPAQRELIERAMVASPYDAEAVLAERKAREQESLTMARRWVAERPPAAKVQADLHLLAEHAMHSPRERYRDYAQRVGPFNCALSAQIHNTATAAQRQRAVERLRGWEADLQALSAQGAPAGSPSP